MKKLKNRPLDGKHDRREFLHRSVTTALAPAAAGVAGSESLPNREVSADQRSVPALQFPRTFTGKHLDMIAFPLGGIGTGSISLGGRGELRDWEIQNRPGKGKAPEYCFAALYVETKGREPVSRIIEARLSVPYQRGASGLGSANFPGMPRFDSAVFTGRFPLAHIRFTDAEVPVEVELEAFNPFIPLAVEASSLPVAILRYTVSNPASRAATVAVALSVDNPAGRAGRVNERREQDKLTGLYMHDPSLPPDDPQKGSFVLAAWEASGEVTVLDGWRGYGFWVAPATFWNDFTRDGRLDSTLHPEPNRTGSVAVSQLVKPGEKRDFVFVLAWHFHNRTPEGCGWTAAKGQGRAVIGNLYSRRFTDAWAAATYTMEHLEDLEKQTRDFSQALENTALPPAVVDAASANLSTLHTTTVFQTEEGRFHAFEGSGDEAGCCFGSCTHVLNYEFVLPSMFPALSRSLRESSFDFCTDEEGRMDFRYLLPYGIEHFGLAAADGQMGTVVKFYQDWRLAGADDWLGRWWPKVKRALEFAWVPGGWDADQDGVMEGTQHTTFDVEFYGPNPLCGFWYLAALRAGEEMAAAVGDFGAQRKYRALFENGSRWIDDNLFNGEFYIQKVLGRARSGIAKGLIIGYGARDTERPDFQIDNGCMIDQLVGQYAAHMAGLGHLADPAKIRTALRSIYRYNFKEQLSSVPCFARTFALDDESGVIVGHYKEQPKGILPVMSSPEVWTGSEYELAAHMLHEGLHEQGLRIIRAVRERYDGERRNPWDEAECGHHYIRAMAAWSCYAVLSGFDYDGRRQHLSLIPRYPGSISAVWTVPSGWGSYQIAPAAGRLSLQVRSGELSLKSLQLQGSPEGRPAPRAKIGERPVSIRTETSGESTLLRFVPALRLSLGEELRLFPTG